MTHVTEKIAEFVFEELSPVEMTEAKRHLAQCSDCSRQVDEFRTIHAMLRSSQDAEPPRRIMFEFEKPRAASWAWRWLAPMAASAAVTLAVVSLAPRPQPQIIERLVQQQAAAQPVQPVAAEPIDYQKIEAWLAGELKKRDANHAKEIIRIKAAIEATDKYQEVIYRDTQQNAGDIQMVAKLMEKR